MDETPDHQTRQRGRLATEDVSTLIAAVCYGDLAVVLDSSGLNPNLCDSDNCSLLHWAALNDRLEIATVLLERGAKVNAIGGLLRETPLHWALRRRYYRMMDLLITHGADIQIANSEGRDAVHLACTTGGSEMIQLLYILLHWGADPNTTDSAGDFALHVFSMASIETKNPVWLEDRRIRAVSSSSIDKSSLSIDRGEISFEKFKISTDLLRLTSSSEKGYPHFQNIIKLLPIDYLSDHISRFVEHTQPFGDDSIVFHVSREIKGSEAIDEDNISRTRGMFGGQDYEYEKFAKAVHHFKVFINSAGMARLIYNYRATDKSITFLKVRRKKI
jgi:hypothetical protein